MTPNDATLLSCPFCSGEPIVRRGLSTAIWCYPCGFYIGREIHEDAIAAWNRRTPSAIDDATIERMVEAWLRSRAEQFNGNEVFSHNKAMRAAIAVMNGWKG